MPTETETGPRYIYACVPYTNGTTENRGWTESKQNGGRSSLYHYEEMGAVCGASSTSFDHIFLNNNMMKWGIPIVKTT
nr:unnamed protein product [Callosobruchus chinensis]